MEPFFLVWNVDRNGLRGQMLPAPRYQHASEESAIKEAERLARQYPGQEFVVLQSVVGIKVNDIERTDLRPPLDIPF
jgi:hypothetical protein